MTQGSLCTFIVQVFKKTELTESIQEAYSEDGSVEDIHH